MIAFDHTDQGCKHRTEYEKRMKNIKSSGNSKFKRNVPKNMSDFRRLKELSHSTFFLSSEEESEIIQTTALLSTAKILRRLAVT